MSERKYEAQRTDVLEAFEGREVDPAKLTPRRRLAEVCGWHLGDPNWAARVLAWAEDCGLNVTES
jgi:hypothetical protein